MSEFLFDCLLFNKILKLIIGINIKSYIIYVYEQCIGTASDPTNSKTRNTKEENRILYSCKTCLPIFVTNIYLHIQQTVYLPSYTTNNHFESHVNVRSVWIYISDGLWELWVSTKYNLNLKQWGMFGWYQEKQMYSYTCIQNGMLNTHHCIQIYLYIEKTFITTLSYVYIWLHAVLHRGILIF